MGRSTYYSRPSRVLAIFGLVAAVAFTLNVVSITASPLPSPQDTARDFNEAVGNAAGSAHDFVDRAKNTFSGKAGPGEEKGLKHWELAAIIAAAVILLLILPCCIAYCLCECVKELICCICCCGCCRD